MKPAKPFWSQVHFGPSCWEWMGCKGTDGYGHRRHEGKVTKAHRLSWEEINGPIPPDILVLHRCDNPPCVRPDHLFLGTKADNAVDMCTKGRQRRDKGQHHAAKSHCPRGHEYAGDNLRVYRGSRFCRACQKLAAAEYHRNSQTKEAP